MATRTDISDIQDEVERILRKCGEGVLKQVAEILKVLTDGKDKRQLLRDISFVMDDIEEADQKVAAFQSFVSVLPDEFQRTVNVLLAHSLKEGEVADVKDGGLSEGKMKIEDATPTADVEVVSDQTVALLKLLGLNSVGTSAFRRECKIAGVIGGTNESQRLNYISLCTQVGDLRRKGFESYEIVSAIRKAIPSGTELRTYLDSMPTITLEEMLNLIRSAYKEKSTTELFRELDKLCQREKEDGPAFLFRALSLRQRILKAAEAEGEISYDRLQVVSVFMHSVRTGLLHDAVRSHMAPFLDAKRDPPDHVLMLEINKAQDELNERLSKQKDAKPKVQFQVNEVGCDNMVQTLLGKIDSLTSDMRSMKTDLANLQRKSDCSGKSGGRVWKRRGCDACVSKGGDVTCTHCWACGGDGHQSRNCQMSSNKKGLRERRDGH